MEIGHPSVHEVWRLALPATTKLANTQGDLNRPVSWAHRMSSQVPAFGTLEQDEIVLLSVNAIPLVDDRLTLAKIIEGLAERNIAALSVVGKVSQQAQSAANKRHLCLLVLPENTDLRDVERDIVRLIVEREAQLDRRGRQIYRQLAQFSIENHGLQAIAEALRKIANKSIVIQNEHLVIQAQALTETCPFSPDKLDTLLANKTTLDRWVFRHPLDSKAPPGTRFDLPTKGWAQCITAIVIEEHLAGYLSILGPKDNLDDLDRLATERGSLVCAVELAKQRAVVAVEHQLRGSFLDMLLTAGPREEPALNRRAAEMGYTLNRQHTVLLFALNQNVSHTWSVLASEFRASLLNTGIQVFLCTYEEKLAALCSTEDEDTLKALIRYAQITHERVTALIPHTHVAIGIGKQGAGLSGLRRSFAQAREALTLAQTLFKSDKVLTFGDLGLYHLLQRLQSCEELLQFHSQTLAPLVAYDVDHDAQLVLSLEAFFHYHGNVSQTAEALHLHRNSLLYRIERINEITGMDLNDADDRFALQLALKLHPFLTATCV